MASRLTQRPPTGTRVPNPTYGAEATAQPHRTEQSRVFLKGSIRKNHFFNITFAEMSPRPQPRPATGSLRLTGCVQTSPQRGLQVGVPPLLPLQRALVQGSEDGLVKSLRRQLLGKLGNKNRPASPLSLANTSQTRGIKGT